MKAGVPCFPGFCWVECVWSGHTVWHTVVPSNTVAVSEHSPPRVRRGFSGEKAP